MQEPSHIDGRKVTHIDPSFTMTHLPRMVPLQIQTWGM